MTVLDQTDPTRPARTPRVLTTIDPALTGLTGLTGLTVLAAAATEDVDAALVVAREWGPRLPPPGDGATSVRFDALRAIARGSVTAARVVEPHLDALAVLAEAGADPGPAGATWGVFAAEASGTVLEAEVGAAGWTLRGRKPWCSLADRLDRALVTAHTDAGRRLFAVDLHHPGVTPAPAEGWVSRGLREVVSVPVDFDAVPAHPVGAPGWYLERPGFASGGIGVAAAWLGGAEGLADALTAALLRRDGGDLDARALGAVDACLHAAAAVVDGAAHEIDAGAADGPAGVRLASRVRAVVARAVDDVLREVTHTLGPGPLAFDAAFAARVADLTVYVRQHHGDRDLAALGRELLAARR